MELMHRRCAGLDVHKDTVVASVRIVEEGSAQARTETRTFGTTTKALMGLSAWLEEQGVTHAVMESTGVYWKPVWHVLEGNFTLLLGNAAHLRNVPGRKTDVKDAEWLSSLLAHGLVRASFIPPPEIASVREYTRARKQLVREQARHVQRIQKVLEDCNIKLASYISDVMGKSGRAIVEAIVKGEADPEALAALATTRLKATREEIVESLRGKVGAHHRVLLKLHLDQYDAIDKAIDAIDIHIDEGLRPFREAAEHLKAIPGISDVAAEAILSEVGTDMRRFPSAGHFRSWAGLVPRMDESAGKRRSTRIKKGANWLKTMLVQCAWAAIRKNNSYYGAQFRRISHHRGPKKAIIAVAASLLTAIYHVLKDNKPFADLGANYFDRRDESKVVKRLERRLQKLGYEVTLKKAA